MTAQAGPGGAGGQLPTAGGSSGVEQVEVTYVRRVASDSLGRGHTTVSMRPEAATERSNQPPQGATERSDNRLRLLEPVGFTPP